MASCPHSILAGAEDPLPSRHIWFEGNGYGIYAADQPRSRWREHTHECVQVSIGLEARVFMEWRTDSHSLDRLEVSGNVVAVIPAGEPHRTLWKRQAILVHIYFSSQYLSSVAARILHAARFALQPVHLVRDPLIEELARALYRECEAHNIDKHYADSVATVLGTHLLRAYNTSAALPSDLRGGLGPARERRVRKYIEQSIQRDLSIEALARVAGLSAAYFASLFRQTTGFTPHEYVSRRRVERAQELLTNPDLPLTEVAHRCGFASQSQFTTVFRRFTGITPARFRTEHATVPESGTE
jgi:AraC family transcriptional regulator